FTGDADEKEALRRKLARIRAQLLGPSWAPLVELLVARVAICWLDAWYSDLLALADEGGGTPDYYAMRQSRAHRRLLSSRRTLAVCRRLAVTTVRATVAMVTPNIK